MNQNPAIAVAKAAMEAVKTTAERETNHVSIKSVTDAQPEMTATIKAAVEASPVFQNLASSETHFWQRRSFWSQVGSALGGASAIAVLVVEYFMSHTTDAGTTTFSALGLAFFVWSNYSSYRSRNASTPLWTKPVPHVLSK